MSSHPEVEEQKLKKLAPQKTFAERLFRLISDIFLLIITGGSIYFFDVINVMIYSVRVYRWVLNTSLFFHFIGFLIATWMAWVTMRTDPDMKTEQGQKQVHAATGCFVVGTVLWMIAVWPVFHFWTIPLSICFLFFTVTAVSLFSTSSAKKSSE